MTMHEFDERLSAYLDGKLSATEKAQVEEELRQNPELRAVLERLKKLDQIARQSHIDMPADGYFDGLAERIDAKLARDLRPRRGLAILQPIMPKSRVIAILSSVAALFLIVVVVNQIWKPASERYTIPRSIIVNPPQKQPERGTPSGSESVQPAIMKRPIQESDVRRRNEVPDSALGKVVQADRTPVAVKDEDYKEPPVFPTHKEAKPEITVESISVAPAGVGNPAVVTSSEVLSAGRTDKAKNAMIEVESAPMATKPVSGVSIPLMTDSVQVAQPEMRLNKGKFAETFDAAAYEQRVQALLDSGKYVPVYFVAWDHGTRKTTSPYDVENAGYQDWYDSLSVMGTEQWQVENAYREATRSRGNRLAEYITARLYIEHYLSSGDPRDVGLWRERLDEVRQWEQRLRK
ncbi:MAG: zf-HC2 domain-containing protein [candidate division Zixibacteria bacterium]|nr:zf-HC2 domain-containing protein [candidate division Zixibacteria bacterium]